MINKNLINKFRDYVNNDDYVLNTFSNNAGKNKWNCICSCIDWLDVTIAQLIYLDSQDLHEDINIRVMNFYSFLSAIDTLYESINQLHRIILSKTKLHLKNESKILKKCRGFKNLTDDKYFKEIRSIFGAHPVNLSSDKDRRFASWPTDLFLRPFGFECFLYSSNPEDEDIIFNVNKLELIKYLQSRYVYLEDLIQALENQKALAYDKLRNEKIKVTDSPLSQLIILKNELQNRYLPDYYESVINKLIYFYKLDREKIKNKNIVNPFFKQLDKLIESLKRNIQNMNFYNLKEDFILSPKIPQELHYEYSKISSRFYNGYGLHPYNLYLDNFEKKLENILEIPQNLNFNEKYLLIIIGFASLK